MRLGAYPAVLAEGSLVREIYGVPVAVDRHRHRYEVNVNYRAQLEAAGLRFSGMSPDGLLPKICVDGRRPWQVYARPFNNSEPRPRVAIVLSGLGLSSAATESAIQGLPGGVTLAFHPYADNLQQWINLARAAGHEVLINLPLEPLDYPKDDPGPQALFTAFKPVENIERLNWALSRVTGYTGVSTHMGSRFTT